MFYDIGGREKKTLNNLRINVIVEYLLAHPDIKSWYAFFEAKDEMIRLNDAIIRNVDRRIKMNEVILKQYYSYYLFNK